MNVAAWNKEMLVRQHCIGTGMYGKHSAESCGPQEKDGRKVSRCDSYERAECPRRLGDVTYAQRSSDCEREPRFLGQCLRCGYGVSVRGHSGCPNRRPNAGRYCLPCLWQGLLHQRRVRKPRTSRWPNCPDPGPGIVRCKKGSPHGPTSPSLLCKWGICVSSRVFSSPRTLRSAPAPTLSG